MATRSDAEFAVNWDPDVRLNNGEIGIAPGGPKGFDPLGGFGGGKRSCRTTNNNSNNVY